MLLASLTIETKILQKIKFIDSSFLSLRLQKNWQAGEQGVPPPVEQGEARPVAVKHDKGCFYTCHGPFNHLPLQTSRPPQTFPPAAARLGPTFNVEVLNLTVSSIKTNKQTKKRVDSWLER